MTDRSVPGERVPGTPSGSNYSGTSTNRPAHIHNSIGKMGPDLYRCDCGAIWRDALWYLPDEKRTAPPTGVPPEALTVFRDMRWFIEQAIEGWEDDRDVQVMRSRLSTIATALRESRKGDK